MSAISWSRATCDLRSVDRRLRPVRDAMRRWLRARVRWAVVCGLWTVGVASPATAQQYLIVVGGIGGEPKYQAAFSSQATRLVQSARERYGFPEADVVLLTEDPERDGADGRATKDAIERALGQLARRVEPNAQVFIVLIGHGSGLGGSPRFNVPGPDVSASDFALWLGRFPSQQIVFVNLSSASGAFLQPLSRQGRVVITATRSASERNEVRFAEHFVNALAVDGSDTDKDGRVSMLEAFSFARREVEREYERDNLLLTEHAMLDDDGDGKGSREPTAAGGDGGLASTIAFGVALSTVEAIDDPELAALYAKQQGLRRQLDDLRTQRSTMDQEEYEAGLERLLLEFARTGRAIREREGGGP